MVLPTFTKQLPRFYLIPVAEIKFTFICQFTFNASAVLVKLMKNPQTKHLNPLVKKYRIQLYGLQVVVVSHAS